jgi:hypothetical protein
MSWKNLLLKSKKVSALGKLRGSSQTYLLIDTDPQPQEAAWLQVLRSGHLQR